MATFEGGIWQEGATSSWVARGGPIVICASPKISVGLSMAPPGRSKTIGCEPHFGGGHWYKVSKFQSELWSLPSMLWGLQACSTLKALKWGIWIFWATSWAAHCDGQSRLDWCTKTVLLQKCLFKDNFDAPDVLVAHTHSSRCLCPCRCLCKPKTAPFLQLLLGCYFLGDETFAQCLTTSFWTHPLLDVFVCSSWWLAKTTGDHTETPLRKQGTRTTRLFEKGIRQSS